MSIIFQAGNNFWIEEISLARVSIAGGGFLVDDVPLTRSGSFLAVAACLDGNEAVTVTPDFTVTIKQTSGAQLTFGLPLTTIRIHRQNNDAGAAVIGVHVILMMRGHS